MNAAKNVANTLKQVIVRISPVSQSPVIFDALSKENGQLRCVVGNEDKVVGLDFYAASIPMEDEQARQVVKAYAEKAGIPLESVLVRHRLPKTNLKPEQRTRRKTDDANLVLVHGSNKATAKAQQPEQDYRSLNEKEGKQDELTKAVQGMQDAHDGKSTPENPEGAVVKAADNPRTKRKYNRAPKAQRSAKSKAAYERYMREISEAAAKSPTMEASVQKAEQASVEAPAAGDIDEAKLAKALRLAKLMIDSGLVD